MELGLKSGPKSHGGVEWVLSTFWVGIAETKAGPGAAKRSEGCRNGFVLPALASLLSVTVYISSQFT